MEHDRAAEQQQDAKAASASPPVRSTGGVNGSILALQMRAGNRATEQYLRRMTDRRPVSLQRDGIDGPGGDGAEALDTSQVPPS